MSQTIDEQNIMTWAKEILSAYTSFYEQFALITQRGKETFDRFD
jgi:hypothetical protein